MRNTCAAAALAAAVLYLAAAGCGSPQPQPESGPRDRSQHRHLLIVLDGLRPDYVTPELMPNLHALGARGVVFTDHHAVYPTVTRVNAASISTGAYPETHGLLGNSVFFPDVDDTRFLNTGERANLLRIESAEGGRLLTAPTLGERLESAGLRLLVASAGSTGSSFLLNHTVAGGGIIHYDYALPATLGDAVREQLGPAPPAAMPNRARNRYIVDAFLEVGLERVDPTVAILWLSDPDTTAHAHGIGHPTSVAALRAVDAELERLQAGLRAAGLLDTFNIWVTSDHGFSTHTGAVDINALLAPFAGELAGGSPRVVAGGGAIYVRDGDAAAVAGIVAALQGAERVGAIFTRDGRVPGTLAFDDARWDHERAADILYSPAWDRWRERLRLPRDERFLRHGRARQHEPVRHSQHADRGRPGFERRYRGIHADIQRRPRAHVSLPPRADRRADDERTRAHHGHTRWTRSGARSPAGRLHGGDSGRPLPRVRAALARLRAALPRRRGGGASALAACSLQAAQRGSVSV